MIFHDYLISFSYINQAPHLFTDLYCVILMCQHILHTLGKPYLSIWAAKGLSSCRDKKGLFVHIMTFCHMHTCCFKVSLKWIGSSPSNMV